MLRLVRRPVTTLGCVLLQDSNWAFVAALGPKINFQACLWVLQGPRHLAKCLLSIQHLILLLMFCVETPRDGSGPVNFCVEPPLASLSVISVRRVKKLFPHLLDLSIPNGCILLPSSSHRDLYPYIMKSRIVEALTLGCHPLATERPMYTVLH